VTTADVFADLLDANARYAASGPHEVAPTGVARKGLALLTCIDTRIDPLAVFGLLPGDAKILRNAGARATDDALRSLALSTAALGVTRIALIQHTDCKVASASNDDLIAAVVEATGSDQPGFDPLGIEDQVATVLRDVELVKASPLIPKDVAVAGFVLDLHAGRLVPAGD
jgi:carbonic anhydrase